MKKKIALLLVLALTMTGLAACGDDTDKAEDTKDTTQTEETDTETFFLNDEDLESYITLPDNYNAMPVSIAPIEVADTDIDNQIASLIEGYADTLENVETRVERAIENGDTVNIDYVGTIDGVAFDGGTSTAASNLVIGSGSFIPGFEDGLVGVMPGETVTVDATFPDPYDNNPDLAGVTAQFEVTVHYIMPSAEDLTEADIAIMYPDCTTLEDLRTAVEKDLYDTAYANAVQSAVLDAIIDTATYAEELPAYLTNVYYNNILTNLETQASYYGTDLETFVYLSYYQDLETFQNSTCWDLAAYNTKYSLFCQAVANKEGLKVTDDELTTQLQSYVDYYGYESIDASFDQEAKESIRNSMMSSNVLQYLVDNAVVTIQEPDADDTTDATDAADTTDAE